MSRERQQDTHLDLEIRAGFHPEPGTEPVAKQNIEDPVIPPAL